MTSITKNRDGSRPTIKRKSPAEMYDEGAEQSVLACILLESDRIREVGSLEPEYFGLESHGAIFRAMRRLYGRGKSVDVTTLAAQLDAEGELSAIGGRAYLTQLLESVPSASQIQEYAGIVCKQAVKRETVVAGTKLSELGYDSANLTTSEIFDRAVAIVKEIPRFETTENLPATWAEIDNALAPISWAWEGWLPRGFLTIVVSEGGQGKSLLALRLAGCFLRDDALPDGKQFTGANGLVLWCETEAAQALNLQRACDWRLPLAKLLTPFADPFADVRLDNSEHRNVVTQHLHRPDVAFMVVDSLRGSHERDENASEMFSITKFLAELARDTDKPILLTHHLSKVNAINAGGEITLDRVRGSTAITQTARVVWAVDTPDPRAKNKKRLAVIKSNLARFPDPIGFEITDSGMVFTAAPAAPRHETIGDRAVDLLHSLLADGPKPATVIKSEFEQAGISWQAANRAKDKLCIVSVKPGGVWHWSLPPRG